MKQHFGEANKNLLISGPGVDVPGTIADAKQILSEKEDDNINTIGNVMSNVMDTMQIASNVCGREWLPCAQRFRQIGMCWHTT